jgi:hypothetical protein
MQGDTPKRGLAKLVFLAAVLITTAHASAKDFVANSTEGLVRALATAQGGDRILLAPGQFGPVAIGETARFSTPLVITSQDTGTRASITGLTITGASNLTLDGVNFHIDYKPGEALHKRVIEINSAQDITITNAIFNGELASGTGALEDDGFGAGYGLVANASTRIVLKNSQLRGLRRGAIFNGCKQIEVSKNEVSGLRDDAFDFVGGTGILIEGNHIHDFVTSRASSDLPDMIQFWTSKSPEASSNVKIRGNFLDAGVQFQTNSILMNNEAVVHEGKGEEMYYRDIEITGNVIRNGNFHGAVIAGVDGLVIANNTVLQLLPPTLSKDATTPYLMPLGQVKNVRVERNVVPRLQAVLKSPPRGWKAVQNYEAQRERPGVPNYYQSLFVNALARKSMTLADLAVLPGSQLDGRDVGSPLLRFDTKPKRPAGYILSRVALAGGFKLVFDASHIYGPDGLLEKKDVVAVTWDFGDKDSGKGMLTEHHYAKRGIYNVTAKVRLASGEDLTLERSIEIGDW